MFYSHLSWDMTSSFGGHLSFESTAFIKASTLHWNQRLHWTQIIWVCPDIWVFSVLDNRHLSDIWVICQKCQFEERKGWKALFLQSQEMQYNKQTLPYWNFYFLDPIQILQSCKIFGLSFFCSYLERICTFVALRDMLRICAFWYFLLRFDSHKCNLTQTLLRYLAKKMVSGASASITFWFIINNRHDHHQL